MLRPVRRESSPVQRGAPQARSMPDSRPRLCDEPPPAALLAGIEQFNQGAYFEGHETLEAIWMGEPGDIRRLYQGILQIGVGFYHLQRGNYRGTLNLLASGVA